MNELTAARVLYAAIILGGSTLDLYKDFTVNLSDKKKEAIHKNLKILLRAKCYGLGFEDIYAKWLAENLYRLNELSIELIEGLDSTSSSYHNMKLSTIAQFDYGKELK